MTKGLPLCCRWGRRSLRRPGDRCCWKPYFFLRFPTFGHEVDALEASGQVSMLVSNILKTKHDTVKNSISNIR